MSKNKLSKNFAVSEILVSKDHPELIQDYVPTTQELLIAQVLALSILQPIRDEFGVTNILSWLRPEPLNTAIGGSKTSDHILGAAADFYVSDKSLDRIYQSIFENKNIPYKQMILYPDHGFIHISCNTPISNYRHRDSKVKKGNNYIDYKDYITQ